MNKAKRARIQEILDRIETIQHELDDIKAEEQDRLDRIPDNPRNATRSESAEEAIDYLEEFLDIFERLHTELTNAIE